MSGIDAWCYSVSSHSSLFFEAQFCLLTSICLEVSLFTQRQSEKDRERDRVRVACLDERQLEILTLDSTTAVAQDSH